MRKLVIINHFMKQSFNWIQPSVMSSTFEYYTILSCFAFSANREIIKIELYNDLQRTIGINL